MRGVIVVDGPVDSIAGQGVAGRSANGSGIKSTSIDVADSNDAVLCANDIRVGELFRSASCESRRRRLYERGEGGVNGMSLSDFGLCDGVTFSAGLLKTSAVELLTFQAPFMSCGFEYEGARSWKAGKEEEDFSSKPHP